jgi:hypothetical protein
MNYRSRRLVAQFQIDLKTTLTPRMSLSSNINIFWFFPSKGSFYDDRLVLLFQSILHKISSLHTVHHKLTDVFLYILLIFRNIYKTIYTDIPTILLLSFMLIYSCFILCYDIIHFACLLEVNDIIFWVFLHFDLLWICRSLTSTTPLSLLKDPFTLCSILAFTSRLLSVQSSVISDGMYSKTSILSHAF